jgi:hypothetical protein
MRSSSDSRSHDFSDSAAIVGHATKLALPPLVTTCPDICRNRRYVCVPVARPEELE